MVEPTVEMITDITVTDNSVSITSSRNTYILQGADPTFILNGTKLRLNELPKNRQILDVSRLVNGYTWREHNGLLATRGYASTVLLLKGNDILEVRVFRD